MAVVRKIWARGKVWRAAAFLVAVVSASTARASEVIDPRVFVAGFAVDYGDVKAPADSDTGWEQVSGGELRLVRGTDDLAGERGTNEVAGAYISPVVLRGKMPVESKSGATGFLVNGRFSVEISGAPRASATVVRVAVDDLVVDPTRGFSSTGETVYRVLVPFRAQPVRLVLAVQRITAGSELKPWWDQTLGGSDGRKEIVISLKDGAGAEARRYTFSECIPLAYSPMEFDRRAAEERTTVECNRVQFGGRQRSALNGWINDVVTQGLGSLKRNLAVTEILENGSRFTRYTYVSAFPIRYVFPVLDVSKAGQPLTEEVWIQPELLELTPGTTTSD